MKTPAANVSIVFSEVLRGNNVEKCINGCVYLCAILKCNLDLKLIGNFTAYFCYF